MPQPQKARVEEAALTYDPELTPDSFTQVPNSILRDGSIPANARLLYFILLSYCWQKATTWPGQALLAKEMGVEERQVRRILTKLKSLGYISYHQYNRQETNVYHIHKRPLKAKKQPQPQPQKEQPGRSFLAADRTKMTGPGRSLMTTESDSIESDTFKQHHAIDDDASEIGWLLEQMGFRIRTRQLLIQRLEKNGRKRDYLKGWIKYIEHSETPIPNPSGYLRRMIERDEPVPPAPPTPAEHRAANDAKKFASWEKIAKQN